MTDIAARLRLRADAIKTVARQSYDVKLRDVMHQTAQNFEEAAAEIERLRRVIFELGGNSHTE